MERISKHATSLQMWKHVYLYLGAVSKLLYVSVMLNQSRSNMLAIWNQNVVYLCIIFEDSKNKPNTKKNKYVLDVHRLSMR